MKSNLRKCEICEEEASNICYQCNMYLCEKCFKFIHEKKPKSQHKKEVIDLFVPINIKCSLHSEDNINLFCIDEKGMQIILLLILFFQFRVMLFNVSFYESSYWT